MRMLIVFVWLFVSDFSYAVESYNFYDVKYIRNYDADTVSVDIPYVHPLLGKSIRIRLQEINSPEILSKNECERTIAIKGREYVAAYLDKAKRIDLLNVQRGNYFRLLADVVVNGKSLSKLLLKKKLAIPYEQKDFDWCTIAGLSVSKSKSPN